MTTPYKDKLGKDLDNVFHPLEDNTKASKTNFRVDGSDLNNRYAAVKDGDKIAYDTGYKVNGTDLKDIFAGLGTITQVYPPMTPGKDPPVGTRAPLLNRVEMTGEGGYMPMSYMYQNIDTLYMLKESTDMLTVKSTSGYLQMSASENNLYAVKKTQVPDDRWGDDLKITRDDGHTVTFATIPNAIRMATGNLNSCIMFRDGAVATGSGTLYGLQVPEQRYQYNWLADNWMNIVDMFMPTTYLYGSLPQVAIMRDKSLIGLDLMNPTIMANPPTILSDLKRIRAINQGHASDMICETNDGSLYWVHGHGYNDNGVWRADKMNLGVQGDEIHLMSLGDYGKCCRVVLHGEPNKTRIIHNSRTLNGNPTIPHVLNSPVTFSSDLLDITANEIAFTYAMKNKVVFEAYLGTGYETNTSTWGDYIRTVGSTAYAVIHKYTTGYYVGAGSLFGGSTFLKSKNFTALEKYIIDNA